MSYSFSLLREFYLSAAACSVQGGILLIVGTVIE